MLVKNIGPDHPDTLTILNNIAGVYLSIGQTDQAIPLLLQAEEAQKRKLGADHPATLQSSSNLVAAYFRLGQFDRSIPLLEQILATSQKNTVKKNPNTLRIKARLATHYVEYKRIPEAMALLEAVRRDGKELTDRDWMNNVLSAYIRAGKSAEGISVTEENVRTARKTFSNNPLKLASTLAENGLSLLQLKAWTDGEQLLRESLAIREKNEPDAWTTFNTRSLLGSSLLGQKKYSDAEPLLISGYQGLQHRSGSITPNNQPRLSEALDRLIQFYNETNKPDEIKKWQHEKATWENKVKNQQVSTDKKP